MPPRKSRPSSVGASRLSSVTDNSTTSKAQAKNVTAAPRPDDDEEEEVFEDQIESDEELPDVTDVTGESPSGSEVDEDDDAGSDEGPAVSEESGDEEDEDDTNSEAGFDSDSGDEDADLDEDEDDSADELDEKAMHQAIKEMEAGQASSGGRRNEDGSGGEEVDPGDGGEERHGKREKHVPLRFQQTNDDDSSEDERENRNTVGKVPLKWYDEEEHIGYDKQGKKLIKSIQQDQLEEFLDRADNKKAWRTVRDEYNDEDVVLTKEEMAMVQRIRKGHFPDVNMDPFPDYVDWMKYDDHIHPLNSAPEPKRRFIPSKWEAKKVVKLVRAMRRGWIKMDQAPKQEEKVYLMWNDNMSQIAEKTANRLTYIPPPKPKLPGHEESYNPSPEFVPTEEEKAAYDMMDPMDRPSFIPTAFDCMRKVPAYEGFMKERFERCLDLYLCPRTLKRRVNMNPEALLPKLPKPKDLQPFPTWQCLTFDGHTDKVWSVSVDPSGQWLASGSDDGTARLWEVRTGRCRHVWELGAPVRSVAWCPNADARVLAVVLDKKLLLLPANVGGEAMQESTRTMLTPQSEATQEGGLANWNLWQGDGGKFSGLEISTKFPIKQVTWHHRGDYFATVAPTGGTASVLVHQISKQVSQNPFRKNKGRVVKVLFHPSKPFFFVATQNHVRIYNLAKQMLAKKLLAGTTSISSMAVHPGGDNLVIGASDKKLAWFDMDLSTKPYKTIQSHKNALQAVAFHKSYPLFASASDDATLHVFHGMVYSDLMQNPLIVPVKILRGHTINDHQGVLDCVFHPTQPWIFTAGADKTVRLFSN
eukprot:CAMPEP_0114284504 /NCGR_PEP_ID=MMETSP0059-20121206/4683_1 /TAXON_ID=36894 /ORGANISM="Pyramimonas parkeae, Strain CCMP726" /LENGTH=811 /DNA_ID=CAMNT_0001405329 /DNA_START=33 /DNA_END=2468 /DNA_ORIENTATION=-